MTDIKPIIAKNLAHFRKQSGLTQAELAEKLNYSDKAISKWERGEGMPDLYVVERLCAIFGVKADYILTEHSEQEKKIDFRPVRRTHRLIANIAFIATWTVALLLL